MKSILKSSLLATALIFTACGGGGDSSSNNQTQKEEQQTGSQDKTQDQTKPFAKEEFGIFTVVSPTIMEMGERDRDEKNTISQKTPKNFERLIAKYPNIKTLNIKWCDGSKDDDANFIVSKNIHNHGINTNLVDGGEIYSGGVDLFLAGAKRTIGKNTKIGVHAWGGEGHKHGNDYHRDHEFHKKYIKYYQDIGYAQTEQESKDFYFFTIDRGPKIHIMTEKEIKKYKMSTH